MSVIVDKLDVYLTDHGEDVVSLEQLGARVGRDPMEVLYDFRILDDESHLYELETGTANTKIVSFFDIRSEIQGPVPYNPLDENPQKVSLVRYQWAKEVLFLIRDGAHHLESMKESDYFAKFPDSTPFCILKGVKYDEESYLVVIMNEENIPTEAI